MSSHDHDSSSTNRPAPGLQPTHLGNATQRAAAVMRQTQATNQTGRSGSPGQGMDASVRAPAPRAALSRGIAPTRAAAQTGSTRPRSRTAAQGIIEAPERPAPRPAINLKRPLPLSQLPHLLRHTALEYGLARVQTHGTIHNRRIVRALRWQHADSSMRS